MTDLNDMLWPVLEFLRTMPLTDLTLPLARLSAVSLLEADARRREALFVQGRIPAEQARQLAFSTPVVFPDSCHLAYLLSDSGDSIARTEEGFQELESRNSRPGLFWDPRMVQGFDEPRWRRLLQLLGEVISARTEPPSVVFQAILRSLASIEGRHGGEWRTPESLNRLMVRVARLQPGLHLYDPACGVCGLLSEALREAAALKHEGVQALGQDYSYTTTQLASLQALFEDGSLTVRQADSLRSPPLRDGQLQRFDRVLTNPPFSLRIDSEALASDPWNRFAYGPLHDRSGDMAFLQAVISSLKPDGIAVTLLTMGALFRSGAEEEVRQRLIQADLIEAVVALPAGLFQHTSIPCTMLIINRNKPAERRQKVLFVNEPRKTETGLLGEDVDKIVHACLTWEEEAGFARIVTADTIQSMRFNLNVLRYIDDYQPSEVGNVEVLQHELRRLEAVRARESQRVDAFLSRWQRHS